jgi:GNAT superfamily N-acetyltransferase
LDLFQVVYPKNRQLAKLIKMTNYNDDPGFQNQLTIEPLTKENWDKFVELFGDKGACGNCWCMYYRLSKADFRKGKSDEGNRDAMEELVRNGKPAGLLGLLEGRAIAWCAFAPREDFIKLDNSRVHKRIDDKPVWSIPCLFIDKPYRRSGVSVQLLKGAAEYAKQNGIKIIEAYPSIPTQDKIPDSFAWTGLYKSFERAGFEIADRTSRNRPLVRYYVDNNNYKSNK